MDDTLTIRVEEDGAGSIVRLAGELDLATVGPARECLRALPDRVVTIDLSEVTFVDGTGIGALIDAQCSIRERGGKLVLFGARPNLVRTLEILRIRNSFDCLVPD